MKNIILFDNSPEEVQGFISALRDETGLEWEPIFEKSNGLRNSFLLQAKRYLKYFLFPLKIFLQRDKYDTIIAWQLFYGLVFAFYMRLFRAKKKNRLFVNIFIYKPKRGLVGKVYFRFMKYVTESGFVDGYSFSSDVHRSYCSTIFATEKDKFAYIPYGVKDFSKNIACQNTSIDKDFILSIGRSNRDWNFLMNALSSSRYSLKIICDELHAASPSANIEIYNSISGDDSLPYFYNAKCVVIPIDDFDIDGGQTVLIKAFLFGKPVIVTGPSTLSKEYVRDGMDGIVIEKTKESLDNAIERLYNDNDLYGNLAKNAREKYEKEFSVEAYGHRWGKFVKGAVK